MQNVIEEITATTEAVQQINKVGTVSGIAIVIAFVAIVSIVVSIINIYRKIEHIIDERIDDRIHQTTIVFQETIGTVKQLEHTVAEIDATLKIMKDILLKREGLL